MNKKVILSTILLTCVSFMAACGKSSSSKPPAAEAQQALAEIQKRSGAKFSADLVPTHYVTQKGKNGYDVWMSFELTTAQKKQFLAAFPAKMVPLALANIRLPIPENDPWRKIAPWWGAKSLSDAEAGTFATGIHKPEPLTFYVIAGNTSKQEATIYLYALIVNPLSERNKATLRAAFEHPSNNR